MSSFQYILFYKPFQVLSQFSKEGDKKTLADYFPGLEKNIYPVGRLDYDSEGLLFLTNDTSINQKLLHPKNGHEKTYWVQVEGAVQEQDLVALEKGVSISVNGQSHKTLPAKAKVITAPDLLPERNPPIRFRKNIPTTWLSITIGEGKNRQVRKMTAAIGFPTLRLIRAAIGNIRIGDLKPGAFRTLNPEEVKQLMQKLV
ncbi:MAG: pseudouridine synthase [Sphingobacteriales bacterium]|nr:MAG: pseudouridine synthase [Sphingobacteriales bacterium]